jgi:FlaA1/EpsC-like NDP-sugar epimerase
MAATDVLSLTLAAWGGYSLRFGELFHPSLGQWLMIMAAPCIAIPIFVRLGLYRSVIRYIGEQALWSIFKGMSWSALVWALLAFLTQMTGAEGVPRSVLVLYWLIGLVLVAGTRFTARDVLWAPLHRRFRGRQTLIYGAGSAGRQLAASLRRGSDFFPAGFLDDDPFLHGADIDSLRVYNPMQLSTLIKRFDISDVIVSMPSASGIRQREMVSFLEKYPVRVRILPSMGDIASGKHLIKMVREVDIGDLLGRDPVAPDSQLLRQCIAGKTVLVTGGGGSIGSELCRQIIAIGPARLVLLEISEYALYQVTKLLEPLSGCTVVPVLGSVQDADLVKRLIAEHGVETLYHAAAYKHVPLVESNILEGVRNNVLGTFNVAQAAYEGGVEHFVLISTDKAVRPGNIMGASKRWAERIVQDFSSRIKMAGTRQSFCAVRFGNVLGSSGSVIPLFKEQIDQGGPVTVTHRDVTRYFMSIHEAVQLVIQAGSMAKGGEIFLLDMGKPVKILDLAKKMIRLAGYTVSDESEEGDIEIRITGLRPGEKLHEELLLDVKGAEGTAHPRIMTEGEAIVHPGQMDFFLGRLREALKKEHEAEQKVREILFDALSEELPVVEKSSTGSRVVSGDVSPAMKSPETP